MGMHMISQALETSCKHRNRQALGQMTGSSLAASEPQRASVHPGPASWLGGVALGWGSPALAQILRVPTRACMWASHCQ